MEQIICGECMFHTMIDGEWQCTNPYSDNYGCETEYKDSCMDGEEKE